MNTIGQEIIKTRDAVLKIEYHTKINYVMLMNGVETCYRCVLDNVGQRAWHQIQICVRGEFVKEHTERLEFVREGQSVQIGNLKILPDVKKLS